MMRKNIKTGLIAFGMCLALPFCSFAAVKNPEKAEGREERAQIRTELACGSHSHFLLNFYTPGPASSAESMQGTVKGENRPEGGAMFTLTLQRPS